jgi:uncharacterized membrane protein required for colicin V production
MYINLVLLVVFGAVVASGAKAGIWTNVIRLFNVITAALLAVNYFEPVGDWLESYDKSYTYLIDFLVLWGLFAVSAGLLRAVTDAISKVKVKFKKQVDLGVGIFFACWTGWIMVSFTAMSLHAAPLARNFLDFQPQPKSDMFLGFLAPDRQWLGFVRKESLGALSRNVAVKQEGGKLSPAGAKEFDPKGDYIYKYHQRRVDFGQQVESRVPTGR